MPVIPFAATFGTHANVWFIIHRLSIAYNRIIARLGNGASVACAFGVLRIDQSTLCAALAALNFYLEQRA
jgi:hypothetical protein